MLAKIIGVVCLLPASFFLHGKSWPGKLAKSPASLFTPLLAPHPAPLQKRGNLYNYFVYYPMRAGRELCEHGSIKQTASVVKRFLLLRLYRKIKVILQPDEKKLAPAPLLPPLPLANLERLGQSSQIKVLVLASIGGLLKYPILCSPGELLKTIPNFTYNELVACLQPDEQILRYAENMVLGGKQALIVSNEGEIQDILTKKFGNGAFLANGVKYLKISDSCELTAYLRQTGNILPKEALFCGSNTAPYIKEGMNAWELPGLAETICEAGGQAVATVFKIARRNPAWNIFLGIGLQRYFACGGSPALQRCESLEQLVCLSAAPVMSLLVLKAMQEAKAKNCILEFTGNAAFIAEKVFAILNAAAGWQPDENSAPIELRIDFGNSQNFFALKTEAKAINFLEKNQPWGNMLAGVMLAAKKDEKLAAQFVLYARELVYFSIMFKWLANAEPDAIIPYLAQIMERAPLANRGALGELTGLCGDNLEKMLDEQLVHKSIFTASGFNDYENCINPALLPGLTTSSAPAGIHVHIYDPALIQEFARYLRRFPFQFDIYATFVDKALEEQIRFMFNGSLLPLMRCCETLLVPNRGRDIAPWLAIGKKFHHKYEYFCHVHTKRSPQLAERQGESWRRYLLDNLLDPCAAKAIMAAFVSDEHLGCVFPELFAPMRMESPGGDTLYGTGAQCAIIMEILERVHLSGKLTRRELFFSAGAMFWYRPAALAILFDADIKLEEFPEEPLPMDGTLAHALERAIPIICMRQGYKAKSLTCYPLA